MAEAEGGFMNSDKQDYRVSPSNAQETFSPRKDVRMVKIHEFFTLSKDLKNKLFFSYYSSPGEIIDFF